MAKPLYKLYKLTVFAQGNIVMTEDRCFYNTWFVLLLFSHYFFSSYQEYVKTDPSGRDPDTPIYSIKQGMEPPSFTGFFGVWDRDLWSVSGASHLSLSLYVCLSLSLSLCLSVSLSLPLPSLLPLSSLALSLTATPTPSLTLGIHIFLALLKMTKSLIYLDQLR